MKFDKIKAALDKIPEGFKDKESKVGWFSSAQYADGTPVAYVASIQEYGCAEVSIPARPFIRNTISERQEAWAKTLADGVRASIDGRANAQQSLDILGMQAAGDIRKGISEVQSPPLSPITLMLRGMRRHDPELHVTGSTVGEAARRVAEGKTNYNPPTKPLVDDGIMLNSLTSQVGRKE